MAVQSQLCFFVRSLTRALNSGVSYWFSFFFNPDNVFQNANRING
jgi:hypothetical protein